MRVLLTLLTLSFAAPALATPPTSKGQKMLLNKGEVIVKPIKRESGVSAKAMGIVDASPDKVWPVVRDCAKFKEFMPRTKASELVKQEGNVATCKIEIEMPFPFSNLWSVVKSTETKKGKSFSRKWNLVEGSYKRNKGSWDVHPWADGKKTLLVYFVDADPEISIPDAIIRSAQTGSLPDMFEAIRERVKKLGG